MAKILVADDNSNIQKMVGLALKDQGIDVVAVGNGEAAVRKISDVRPDLVLADVFMPVRNGYEVCQYVKTDSALAHIPVILLVGAFDPLDEQEAQRVGADGVLKKPFVPPDPLISMVKSALARAGVSTTAAATPTAPPRAAEMISPRTGPASVVLASNPPAASFGNVPTVESEPVPEPIPSRPEPVRIDGSSQPLAFGSLLETPAVEEEEPAYIHPVQSGLGADRDWREMDEDAVVEEEEEETSGSAWRPDPAAEAFVEEETTGPVKDWQEMVTPDSPGKRRRSPAWAPDREKTGFVEAAEVDEPAAPVVTEAAAPAASVPTPLPPIAAEKWNAPSAPAAQETAVQPTEPVQAKVKSEPRREPGKPPADSWYSAVASPWEVEAQKASKLASTWDVPAAAPAAPSESQSATAPPEMTFVEDTAPEVSARVAEEAALPAATVEAIREEAAQLAESAIQEAPAAKSGKEAQKGAELNMEDVVAKVLAKMNPEMLQAVTREILKPVVEAIVRDELNAKK